MKIKIFCGLIPLLLFMFAFLRHPSDAHIVIGLDPSWHTVSSGGKEAILTAFTTELITQVAKKQHVLLTLSYQNWDFLLAGLHQKKSVGICSNLTPHLYNEKTYHFSSNYLETGMVILAKSSLVPSSMPQIGVLNHASINLLLAHLPNASYEIYETLSDALDDISLGILDGVVTNRLMAESYRDNFQFETFMIFSLPLDHEGLKLITLADDDTQLVKKFNQGLLQLKQDGTYDALLKKWRLNLDLTPQEGSSKKERTLK
ncbi:MAG: transporter substrate-binding domain-containing protein [Candidatus Rhabdochlamydia sp.]